MRLKSTYNTNTKPASIFGNLCTFPIVYEYILSYLWEHRYPSTNITPVITHHFNQYLELWCPAINFIPVIMYLRLSYNMIPAVNQGWNDCYWISSNATPSRHTRSEHNYCCLGDCLYSSARGLQFFQENEWLWHSQWLLQPTMKSNC